MIVLDSVSKAYNPGLFKKKVNAVTELSLNIVQGEVFGLIGPNGAGKSTTIRLMLGLIRPDRGAITFHGKPLQAAAMQREIGYLPENPYLYDHLTLDELLEFSGRASGLPAAEIKSRTELLTAKLDMSEARRRPLRTFSKGMLQRAGICFALLHDPALVILDEPMSGLDPIGRKMVFDLVTELKTEGKTVFFCSHILNDVERLCDRIGLVAKGRLLRLLDRDSFSSSGEKFLHFVVPPLSEPQRERLLPLVSAFGEDLGRQVISVRAVDFNQVATELQAMAVNLHGTRSDRQSLEETFMQVVGENR